MDLIKNILTKSDCYKTNKTITPKGVMVHSTGANNPNLKRYCQPNIQGIGVNKYNNDWNRSGLTVCVHAFIGKLENGNIATVQTLPWNHRGWHCGKSGNDTHISFEICEDGLTDKTYFQKVYTEAVELTAYLCKEYNLDPLKDGVVICHSEGYKRGIASNHGDVMHWFPKHGKTMDDFRKDVSTKMGKENTTTGSVAPANKFYRVQCGAFTIKSYAENLAAKLKAAGYRNLIVKDGSLYKVQVGAYTVKANADNLAKELKSKGFQVFVKNP